MMENQSPFFAREDVSAGGPGEPRKLVKGSAAGRIPNPVIEVRDYSFFYGDNQVLFDLNMKIAENLRIH